MSSGMVVFESMVRSIKYSACLRRRWVAEEAALDFEMRWGSQAPAEIHGKWGEYEV